MKKLILLLFIPLVFSCGMSTEELEQEVLKSITEQIAENSKDYEVVGEFIGTIEVVDFKLIHRGGNEYIGILKVLEPNVVGNLFDAFTDNDAFEDKVEKTYEVEVIYDGESYSYKVITD